MHIEIFTIIKKYAIIIKMQRIKMREREEWARLNEGWMNKWEKEKENSVRGGSRNVRAGRVISRRDIFHILWHFVRDTSLKKNCVKVRCLQISTGKRRPRVASTWINNYYKKEYERLQTDVVFENRYHSVYKRWTLSYAYTRNVFV